MEQEMGTFLGNGQLSKFIACIKSDSDMRVEIN